MATTVAAIAILSAWGLGVRADRPASGGGASVANVPTQSAPLVDDDGFGDSE